MNIFSEGGVRLMAKKYQYLVIIFVVLFLLLPETGLTIGLSPALIQVENILPDSYVTRQIYISRANPSALTKVQIIVSGSAADYILLNNGATIDLPMGEAQTAYSFIIQTKDLEPGNYEASLAVNPMSEGQGEDSEETKIMAGAQAEIRFSVTNEELESYTIQNVDMKDTEENQVVGFSYLMVNTGNVDTRPARIEFSVTDENDSSNTYNETISGQDLPLVPAFQEQQVDVATGASLLASLYSTEITFYNNNDEVVFTADNIRLQVFPEGTLDLAGELLAFSADKTEYQEGELVKFNGVFKNTGTVGLKVSLIVEVSIDDLRVEMLKTEPIFLPVGQTTDLELTFRPTKPGTYTVKSHATYGPNKTDIFEVQFIVKKTSTLSIIILLGVSTVVLAAVIWWIYHRRKKYKVINNK